MASFESRREECGTGIAGLGDEQIQSADASVDGAGFEAIGITCALVVTLVGSGMEVVTSLDEHGVIDEEAQGIREAVEAMFKDSVEDFGIEGRLGLFSHRIVVGLVFQTSSDRLCPDTNHPFFLAIRWPEFLAVSLRSTARNSGQRMVSFADFTDKMLHYRPWP